MRWQMVDYRLLQIRLPEVVDPETTLRVVAVSAILYMLIHLVAPPLPNGFIAIAAAIGIQDPRLNYFITGAAPSIQSALMLFRCKPSYSSRCSSDILKLWTSHQPSSGRGKDDAIGEGLFEPVGKLRPILGKGWSGVWCAVSVCQRILQPPDFEEKRTIFLFRGLGAVFGDVDLSNVVAYFLVFLVDLFFETINQFLGKR